ncbi:hypothetical protein AVEN_248701-1, partial [Araneus ventricosus]
ENSITSRIRYENPPVTMYGKTVQQTGIPCLENPVSGNWGENSRDKDVALTKTVLCVYGENSPTSRILSRLVKQV